MIINKFQNNKKAFRTGQAPNVKSRHALTTPIWWLSFIQRHSLLFRNRIGATEARRLRTGQALITGVLFLLFASLLLIFGISAPLLSQIRIFGNLKNSNQSFYASEGAVEDAILKIKRGQNVLSQSTVILNEAEVNVLVSDILGGKEITAEGDSKNHIRKIKSSVSVGEGVAFHYGVQTGNGGFVLGGNAGVIGNVYSNGNIVGSNGSFITASAISANSASLSANQTNNTPTTPTSGIIFGRTSSTEDVAQSFVVSETGPINKVRLNLRKVSTPANINVRIMSDSNGSPSGTTLASAVLSASLVTGQYGFVEAVFSTNPDLVSGTTYWVVLDVSANSSRYYEWAKNTDYTSGFLKNGRVGSSWAVVSPPGDGYFEIYLGGLLGSINNVDVGQSGVGDAHAHTITNSTIAGNLYCQTGSSNNKSCDTSKPDPSATAFPVSDANIAEWKDWASLGGEIIGNYTIDDDRVSLGPKKINGNLIVNNGGRLDVTGTLWVTGNIIISNNATVALDPSYTTTGGVIIADGYIDLSNNVIFSGSGVAQSYILLLSTSNCSGGVTCGGNYAISVDNNVEAAILNAQNGTINISNNVDINAATAKTINMENNAVVTYLSGLADLSFSSGPSGGYEIESWAEIE